MYRNRVLGLALISATLCGAPAFAAQQNNPPPPANSAAPANHDQAAALPANNNNEATAPANNTTAPAPAVQANNNANNNGPDGTLEKYDGGFRASKVVGATVFNSQGQNVGSVDDLLIGNDGKIDRAVISTGGGVLGIGSKLVAVPFDQLKFQESVQNNGHGTLRNTEGPAPAANTANNNHPNRVAPMAATNNPVNTANNNNVAVNSDHPVYYSLVLPDATKDSLSKDQTFKYASTD